MECPQTFTAQVPMPISPVLCSLYIRWKGLLSCKRASWPQNSTCCALDAPADCSGLLSPLISARISLRSHVMSLMFQSCLSSSIGLVERDQLGSMQASYLCMWQNPFSTPCGLTRAELHTQAPFLASDEVYCFTEHSWPTLLLRYHVKGMSGSYRR